MAKRGAKSTRTFSEPFSFHFKKDLKKIFKARCMLSDTDMGRMLNRIVRDHILRSKDVKFKLDDKGNRIEAIVTGIKGEVVEKLEHNLEVN